MLKYDQGFAWGMAAGLFLVLTSAVLWPSRSAAREGLPPSNDLILYFFADGGEASTTDELGDKPADLDTGKSYSGEQLDEILGRLDENRSADSGLFTDATLGVYLSDMENTEPHVVKLAECKRMDFGTEEETQKQTVTCDGKLFTYTYSNGTIRVLSDGEPTDAEFILTPGTYRLNGVELRVSD